MGPRSSNLIKTIVSLAVSDDYPLCAARFRAKVSVGASTSGIPTLAPPPALFVVSIIRTGAGAEAAVGAVPVAAA